VSTAVLFAVLLAIPTVVWYAVGAARRLYERRQDGSGQLPVGPPIERVASDLRRLRVLLEKTENATDQPGKYLRCRAVQTAYVDALTSACRELQVEPPVRGVVFAPQAEIYRVESELRLRGLDVRSA
jgi:hypothetical protein